MPLDFTAIDFETANGHRASACAVGLVKVSDGVVVDKVSWLLRPPAGFDDFLEWNTKIHGIHKFEVSDAPGWHDIVELVRDFTIDAPLVAHNASFDMGVIRSISDVSQVECLTNSYFCSLQLARRTYTLDSYRLPSAAAAAGFTDFSHHDALADSEACAAIVVDAARIYGVGSVADLAEASGISINQLVPAETASAN